MMMTMMMAMIIIYTLPHPEIQPNLIHPPSYILGATSNTTLRILSVRGVPPPLYGQNFRQQKITD